MHLSDGTTRGRGGRVADLGDPTQSDGAPWARVAASLRQRLVDGDFDVRLPTEAELVADYGVSRGTVREAIRSLRVDGLLEAPQGAGTFVLRRQLDEPVLGRLGLARMIEVAGLDERSRLLRAEPVLAGAAAALALGCDPKLDAVAVDRLRLAGEEAIALDRSVILVGGDARRRVLEAALDRGSLYDVLADRAQIRVDGGREVIRAVECSRHDRRLLGLAAKEGALAIDRVAYAGQQPVEWRRTLLKGDRYVLATSWGSPPPAPPGFGVAGGGAGR